MDNQEPDDKSTSEQTDEMSQQTNKNAEGNEKCESELKCCRRKSFFPPKKIGIEQLLLFNPFSPKFRFRPRLFETEDFDFKFLTGFGCETKSSPDQALLGT